MKISDSSIVTIESSVKSKSELPIKSKYSLRSKDKRIPTLKSTKQQISKSMCLKSKIDIFGIINFVPFAGKDVLKNRKMV